MKTGFIVLWFALASALAQTPKFKQPAACGSQKVFFTAQLDDAQHSEMQPEPGKALVYFIQDVGTYPLSHLIGTFMSRAGMDGAWLGANQNSSYFSASVTPGEHHVCVQVQSHFGGGRLVELTHLNVEAGKTYYVRNRIIPTRYTEYLLLNIVDSDEAQSLLDFYPLSVSQPKQ